MRFIEALSIRLSRRCAAALAVSAAVSIGVGGTAAAQVDEAIVLVDVMVINDDGGTLDGTTVPFVHTALGGGTTGGTDNDVDFKCLTSDGTNCYIMAIPTGAGELTVDPVDGYTTTITCTSDFGASTVSGATWDAASLGEIFCVVMLDDDAPTAVTTTTTTTTTLPETTTTAPETTTTVPETTTTVAATTTAPAATVAPATTTAPTTMPTPVMELPETGPTDSSTLAVVAIALMALGGGTLRIARR